MTLSDASAPALGVGGPLVAGALGWLPASAVATARASDNVGIRSVQLLVDGVERSNANPACNFTYAVPCPNVPGTQLGLGGGALTDGTHTVSVVAQDSAGNPSRVDRTAKIDFHAPGVVADLPRHRRFGASVIERGSGLAQLTVTARDDRGGVARPLRLSRLRHGRVQARLPRIPARHLVLNITARDRAGNAIAEDGHPTAIGWATSSVGKHHARVRHDSLHVPFGRPVTVRGRLVDARHRGVAGATIIATTTLRTLGAAPQPAGTAGTNARGRFEITVPAGLSRTLRFTFAGGGGWLGTSRPVRLAVPTRTTLHLSRRTITGAGQVVFRGRVNSHGQPIPPGGLTVLVQGRQGRRWGTFKAARTGRAGRWRAVYRFTGRPGRFPIRALVRRSPTFPFEAGASRVVSVRVR